MQYQEREVGESHFDSPWTALATGRELLGLWWRS